MVFFRNDQIRKRTRFVVFISGLAMLVTPELSAQSAAIPIRSSAKISRGQAAAMGAKLLQEQQAARARSVPSPGNRPSNAAQSKQKNSDPRLKLILQMQLDRSPPAILRAWALEHNPSGQTTRAEPPGPDDPDELKKQALIREVTGFQQDVTLGRWENAAKFLQAISDREVARQIYSAILTKLMSPPTPTAGVPATGIPPNALPQAVPTPVPGVQPVDHVIAPEDLIGLIRLAPGGVKEKDLTFLGSLLVKSIQQGYEIAGLAKQLESGISNMGGSDPRNRLRAARMLLNGNQPALARKFIRPLKEAIADKDIDSIVLYSRIVERLYQSEGKPGLLEDAWQANQAVLSMPRVKPGDLQSALEKAVQLAPKVNESIGQAWLIESFTSEPARGIRILSGIGQAVSNASQTSIQNPAARLDSLKLQKLAVEKLLEAAPDKAKQWRMTLDLLALNWLKEARTTQIYARSSGRPIFRRDRYGNIYYASQDELMGRVSSSQRPRPVSVQDILDVQPGKAWFDNLSDDLKLQFQEILARLYLKNAEEAKAFPVIENVATMDPKRAKVLVDEFLRVWTRNHNPNEDRANRNQYVYFFGFEQRANSIPLTRSKQQRNLRELKEWIARLKKMNLEEIDEEALVRAFTSCHSTAEVYRLEDIEEVFGSVQKLKPNTIAGLVQKMRTNLSTAWRQPRVQEAKKTNRKEPEIQREVLRGYDVAASITREALFQNPKSWELLLAKACITFDHNSYQQEIKKSSEFTQKQKDVFREFARAAKAYADQVPTMDEDQQSTEVYDLWFYASLGACDLALLTHEKLSVESQFSEIRKAIDALPGEAPARHLAQFANKLFTRMSPLKPEMKYRYLKGGFAIVGDHPDAAEARKVFEYYNDLVTEIRLQTVIDGSDVVGQKPFGMFVNLYHTEEVERESGGFGKYLQNQNALSYAYNYGRPPNDYRDAFETSAIAALSEHFDVISVTFEDEKNLESREAPQDGWRITPYAYILLKSRGPEVDIIPPIRMDLDFLDTSGYAVLPIESKAIPLDTQSQAEPRPIRNLKIVQSLDERRSGDGKLVLEVKATARGLVPDFENILKFEDSGFEVVETQDQGVSVSAFDPESNDIQVISEREWLIELKADDDAGIPDRFQFCSALDPETAMSFKRYVDADLIDVEPVVSLENQYGRSRRDWIFWVLGGIPLVAILIGLLLAVMKSPGTEPQQKYQRPAEVNPLSVISLLKQIRQSESLDPDQLKQLDHSIEQIEQHFFFTEQSQAPDLEQEIGRWLAVANRR